MPIGEGGPSARAALWHQGALPPETLRRYGSDLGLQQGDRDAMSNDLRREKDGVGVGRGARGGRGTCARAGQVGQVALELGKLVLVQGDVPFAANLFGVVHSVDPRWRV